MSQPETPAERPRVAPPPESATTLVNPLAVSDKPWRPLTKAMSRELVALVLRESNLPGADDDDDDSDAGDRALPTDLLGQVHLPLSEPDNDNRGMTPERQRRKDRLNRDPALRRRVFRYLVTRHHVPDSAADDIVNISYERAWLADKWPEDDSKRLYYWMRKYTNFTRLRHQRESSIREAREEPTPFIEEHAAPPPEEIDVERQHVERLQVVDHVAALKPEHAHARAVLEKEAATGKTIRAIALEAGENPDMVYRRVQRFKAAVLAHAGFAATASILIGILLITLALPSVNVGAGFHPTDSTPLPKVSEPAAPELRARALSQCEKGRYELCVKLLDRAKDLDPAGDAAPDVVKARAEAAKMPHPPTRP